MTGEMHKSEVTKENFPLHFAIARALRGTVHPFDQYQGPYVNVPGVASRIWIGSDDGHLSYVYNDTTEKQSKPFCPWGAIEKARRHAIRAARQTL